jgi:2-hydroxychromene-2-carboxylate isomerase
VIFTRLKGKAIATWLGPTGEAARQAIGEVRRRVSGDTTRRLDFYFDIADAWSYLAAQAVARLVEAYPVELGFHVVTPPSSDVDPAPAMRATHAVRDAQLLADYWDLDFPGKKVADSGLVRDAGTVLVRPRPPRDQLRCALELTGAMWANDKKKVAQLAGQWGADSHGSVAPILTASYAELRKAGHYLPAMLHYGGTWYWGVDRLPYLEAALAKDLGSDVAHVVTRRADRGPLSLGPSVQLEMWFSFRSPYSYLAFEQIEAMLAPFGVPLVLRPVAPMVARGLPVPQVKRMYIVHDAKREADRLGIPFGEICDPLGVGVDNCLAIMAWASERGAGLAFAKSAMRGIWAEARDVASYVDLRHVVERAGLPWDEAKQVVGNPAAVKQATANAADLAVFGLWGVPSFKVGDLTTWGQDRLPMIAERLRRHAVAGESRSTT